MTRHRQRGSARSWLGYLEILVVLVALVGASVLLRDGLAEPPPELPPSAEVGLSSALTPLGPRPAEEFVDSVGVNVHSTYFDTAYNRRDEWLVRLDELGVRHVRDGLVLDSPVYIDVMLRLAAAGHRMTLIAGDLERSPAEQVALATGPLGEAVAAVESPNELDVVRPRSWTSDLSDFLPGLRSSLEQAASDIPLIGPSFVEDGSRRRIDDLADLWDVHNLHPYPGGRPPGEAVKQIREVAAQAPSKPVVATETGYHNALRTTGGHPPVSEEAAAVYIPRLLLEHFAAGVQRTFLYELIDQQPDPKLGNAERHFGLLRNDLSPKPAYRALQNMLDVIGAGSEQRGRRVTATVLVDAEDVRALVLRRADGSNVLALWRSASVWDVNFRRPESVRPESVRVTFDRVANDLAVYRPTRSAAPVKEVQTTRAVRVPLGGDVVLLSFR